MKRQIELIRTIVAVALALAAIGIIVWTAAGEIVTPGTTARQSPAELSTMTPPVPAAPGDGKPLPPYPGPNPYPEPYPQPYPGPRPSGYPAYLPFVERAEE